MMGLEALVIVPCSRRCDLTALGIVRAPHLAAELETASRRYWCQYSIKLPGLAGAAGSKREYFYYKPADVRRRICERPKMIGLEPITGRAP